MVRENAHTAHVLYTLWLVLYFIRPPFLSRAPESLAYLCVCSVVSDVLRSMEWVAIAYSMPKSLNQKVKIFASSLTPKGAF